MCTFERASRYILKTKHLHQVKMKLSAARSKSRVEKEGRTMPRVHRSIDDIHHEFSDDFTVVNGNLLLCKFCDTIVKWRKKTRVIEHMSTRMHAERKEAKLKRLLQVYTLSLFVSFRKNT